MTKHRIAWLPGDGIGVEVCAAARLVLDAAGLDAEYLHGDIGWEFWRREGDALPARTLDLLRQHRLRLLRRHHLQARRRSQPRSCSRTAGARPDLSQPDRAHAAIAGSIHMPAAVQRFGPAILSIIATASTWWCFVRTQRGCTSGWSSRECPRSFCAEQAMSAHSAGGGGLDPQYHARGLAPDRGRGLRVRCRKRPAQGDGGA